MLFLDDMRNATAADRQGHVRRYTGSDRSEHMIRWRFEPVRAALGSLVLAVGSQQASENPVQPDTIVSERARTADRERAALLESAKAELRRPLDRLVAVAAVLRSGVLAEGDPRRDVYLETLHTTAQRLLVTVNATLDVAEAGSKPLDEMDVHLVGSVMSAARAAARQPDGSQRRIAIDLPPSLPTVRLDPVQFERAVYSLIRYVLSRSPAAAEVLIYAKADSRTGMALLISASDAEVGAGESSTPDNPDASALSLAHEIANLHGGTIRIVYEAASRSLVATLQLPPDRVAGRAA
jgi:signal transduction histidine kinase